MAVQHEISDLGHVYAPDASRNCMSMRGSRTSRGRRDGTGIWGWWGMGVGRVGLGGFGAVAAVLKGSGSEGGRFHTVSP